MKNILFVSFSLLILLSCKSADAQTDSAVHLKTYRVGIFAPLYLDSVFSTAGNFRYRESVPKFMMPALDFVQGAQIALDSMKFYDENIDAFIYDTKSYKEPLPELIKNKKIDSLDLILGSVKDLDYKQLADFAKAKNIPFVSATYPNDGGITGNPFVIVINSTLKAHCEAIYSYLLQNHGTDKIFLCRQKGTQEDKIAGYFKALNEQDGSPLLTIETIKFDSTIGSDFLKPKLDSNRQTIIIGGSLDEAFASSLTAACYDLYKQYPITLIGMPNWDGFKDLSKKEEYEDFPIYFTSPYYNTKADSYSRTVNNGYLKKYKGKPTDMAFKGFECTYLFTKLLAKYPADFMNHLNDKTFRLFSDYNFKPVMPKKQTGVPDYFENKHLYFIKLLNGVVSKAW